MKISAVSAVSEKLQPQTMGAKGTGFGELFERIVKKAESSGISGNVADLATMQKGLESGKVFSPSELILFQVKASKLHLRVELVSKSAETVHATARRLQQGQ